MPTKPILLIALSVLTAAATALAAPSSSEVVGFSDDHVTYGGVSCGSERCVVVGSDGVVVGSSRESVELHPFTTALTLRDVATGARGTVLHCYDGQGWRDLYSLDVPVPVNLRAAGRINDRLLVGGDDYLLMQSPAHLQDHEPVEPRLPECE